VSLFIQKKTHNKRNSVDMTPSKGGGGGQQVSSANPARLIAQLQTKGIRARMLRAEGQKVIHTHTHTHTHTYIYMYIYMYVCVCVYIYIYTYIHTYIHAYIHIYIYIYIYRNVPHL